jgi:hypothetical protein
MVSRRNKIEIQSGLKKIHNKDTKTQRREKKRKGDKGIIGDMGIRKRGEKQRSRDRDKNRKCAEGAKKIIPLSLSNPLIFLHFFLCLCGYDLRTRT